MKYWMFIAIALSFASLVPVRGAAGMECEELDTGEALCDDGTRMYYRSNPSAPFVLLDDDTRLKVLTFLAGNAGGGGPAEETGGDPSEGQTSFFGSTGSITSDGDCVSLSAPGVSFMGSGC